MAGSRLGFGHGSMPKPGGASGGPFDVDIPVASALPSARPLTPGTGGGVTPWFEDDFANYANWTDFMATAPGRYNKSQMDAFGRLDPGGGGVGDVDIYDHPTHGLVLTRRFATKTSGWASDQLIDFNIGSSGFGSGTDVWMEIVWAFSGPNTSTHLPFAGQWTSTNALAGGSGEYDYKFILAKITPTPPGNNRHEWKVGTQGSMCLGASAGHPTRDAGPYQPGSVWPVGGGVNYKWNTGEVCNRSNAVVEADLNDGNLHTLRLAFYHIGTGPTGEPMIHIWAEVDGVISRNSANEADIGAISQYTYSSFLNGSNRNCYPDVSQGEMYRFDKSIKIYNQFPGWGPPGESPIVEWYNSAPWYTDHRCGAQHPTFPCV